MRNETIFMYNFLLCKTCQEDTTITHRVWESEAFFDTLFQSNNFLHIITHSHALQFQKSTAIWRKKNLKCRNIFLDFYNLTWVLGQVFFPVKKIQFSGSLKVHLENNLRGPMLWFLRKIYWLWRPHRPHLNSFPCNLEMTNCTEMILVSNWSPH